MNLVASGPSCIYPLPPTPVRYFSCFLLIVSDCARTATPQDIPNGGVRDLVPLMPGLVNSLSQSIPDPPPSGTSASAMESLKRLADRYLYDPGLRVDMLRMELKPSGGRMRVTIMIDINV